MDSKKVLELNNTSKEQIELLIVKLAKEGKSSAEIGAYLRDQYGILEVKDIIGKKLKKYMKDKGVYGVVPEDLRSLFKRYLRIQKHLEINKKDKHSKRGLLMTESKIKKLIRYYKEKGELDPKFRFDKKNVALYLK